MKKVLKIIVIVVLAVVVLTAAMVIRGMLTPAVPAGYTEKVSTGGEIEKKYLHDGSYETACFEQKADGDYEKFEVWYPKEMTEKERTYPLIVVLNGTGVPASKYKEQFRHFASWGFIVIGTEEKEAWDGAAADDSLAFLMEQNETQGSIFYHRIDPDNISAVGHSQGGAGVFNAITEREHSRLYKTAVLLSPTNEEQTAALGWHYDLSRVDIPILLLAGTKGDFEMKLVIPTEAMTSMYDKLNVPKVMARKLDCEHGEMLYSADGYVTAWLMWQLQGDEEAGGAFAGNGAELLTNPLYREQRAELDD